MGYFSVGRRGPPSAPLFETRDGRPGFRSNIRGTLYADGNNKACPLRRVGFGVSTGHFGRGATWKAGRVGRHESDSEVAGREIITFGAPLPQDTHSHMFVVSEGEGSRGPAFKGHHTS